MSLNLPVFYQRLWSAVIFAIIMVFGLLYNNYTTLLLASIIQFLCFREYFALLQKIEPNNYWQPKLPVIVQILSLLWLWLSSFKYNYYQLPWLLCLCTPAIILAISVLGKKPSVNAGLQSLAGMFYILLPMLLLIQIRTISFVIPMAILLLIWTSDTMAYLVGSFIGKTPFSSISPNKTWEGTIGGAVLTIAVGGIWGYFSHYYNIADWIILGLIVSITAPLGDLIKSKLKRMAGVKDSGKLMPGHGGALDRFDSLLITLPFAFCYVYYFMPTQSFIKFGLMQNSIY